MEHEAQMRGSAHVMGKRERESAEMGKLASASQGKKEGKRRRSIEGGTPELEREWKKKKELN